MESPERAWTSIAPRLAGDASRASFLALAQIAATTPERPPQARRSHIITMADLLAEEVSKAPVAERTRLESAGHLLLDLTRHGWGVRVGPAAEVAISPPEHAHTPEGEKERVRAHLAVSREAQLESTSVAAFLWRMETRHLFRGQHLSIYGLMRDGRELADRLRAALAAPSDEARLTGLGEVIQPYLQVASGEARCEQTGFMLRDIWRYFRHTWANPYKPIPGRSLLLLVRDRAAPYHPVIGIAALISAPAQIRVRDRWIGWEPDEVLEAMDKDPSDDWARWLADELRESREETYVDDLLRDKLLTPADLQRPSDAVISALRAEGRVARDRHKRFADARELKGEPDDALLSDEGWRARAETHLFRSKRALLLADQLRAQRALDHHMGPKPERSGLIALLADPEGRQAVRLVARRAKAVRMGIAIADIGVCGAVAPYNELLGGKLVATLLASPAAQAAYAHRYRGTPSVIASSMAGRPIVRGAELVLLTTTSLYHSVAAQYNRLRMAASEAGGARDERIEYHSVGLSIGFGTAHISDTTLAAFERAMNNATDGRQVNSIFGEGQSPRLRKVRQGLDLLGLPAELLLKHGAPKRVYAVSLVNNLKGALIGKEPPQYIVPQDDPDARTAQMVAWWRRRWLLRRLTASSQDALARVEAHRRTEPMEHGARVVRDSVAAEDDGQGRLFP